MELGLFQTQSMKLVMTQELRQAITILQYPVLELSQFIEQQAVENPLVELRESVIEPKGTEALSSARTDQSTWDYDADNDVNPINFIKSDDDSLQSYLLEQLSFLKLSSEERSLTEYMIFCLNEDGFLDCSLECLKDELDISETEAVTALERIQTFEPVGVGARSLSECLLLQYEAKGFDLPIARTIITDHLEELADKKWLQLTKQLNVSMEELKQAEQLIRSLNPRPCAEFSRGTSEWVQPEFFIERDVRGRLLIRLNEDFVPEIILNERYFRMLEHNKEARPYLEKQLQKYHWLKNSLDQRRQTLRRMGEYLLRAQRDFFDHGFEALRPMTLKEVAESIDVHESTVSRAVKNKMLQTPKGAIPLKSLFTSRIDKGHQNEDMSSTQVKIRIKRLIEREEKRKPLSDQKLADALKEEGIEISRRTVAKYREELRIPPSSKRKSLLV
ncbi:RNA polymerase factor sigma-54 [Alkalihalobacillus sp. AL-G]|uniref:RNA polymerase factor sigma-54 n=1 Tax=Alkalihalobacillus sp. AL-G TaxID=2926399 RepID=UPI00272B9E5B|nr:RNA polymerase factor sigma-54 [Alkalihalobacillus sp. AL-G]WLD92894.1 RNA polymerase factor sigma-54 [Alkalihalobacillus sp. AL-G]